MPSFWRLTAFGAAIVVVASVFVVRHYGGVTFWPGLVTNFAGTLVAVVLALEIESHRERRALERHQEELKETRSTEARKRLLAVRSELEKNQTSIGAIASGLTASAATHGKRWAILHQQLLDGAWSASRERLGDLLADYGLVSDVSIFYGRLEELRWRIRYRTQARTKDLDPARR